MKRILLLFYTLTSSNYAQSDFTNPEVTPSLPDEKPTDPISSFTAYSISTTPIPTASINNAPTTMSSITKTPISITSITNFPITTTPSDINYKIPVKLKNQTRKSVKPLFGLVPTKDFFKILETPMIYRPGPVYISPLQRPPNVPPLLKALRRSESSILCQDFVTPILTAAIRNLTYPYIVTSTDHFITRILRLLHTDTATATEDDIKTMVWQISNIDIRLYQWSALAMMKLLNTISLHNEEDHWTLAPNLRSFRNLKKELEAFLLSWRLDLSDKEPILRDSKIIRPPCCCGNTLGQSTLAPTNTMITTKAIVTKPGIGRMGADNNTAIEEEVVEYQDDSLEVPLTTANIGK